MSRSRSSSRSRSMSRSRGSSGSMSKSRSRSRSRSRSSRSSGFYRKATVDKLHRIAKMIVKATIALIIQLQQQQQ